MDKEIQRKLFLQLILQNQQMALISMGKTSNPVSNQIEKNMEYAKVSVDILDMLLLKTKGNLSPVEEQYLSDMINNLKADYADASSEENNSTQADKAEENREN
jgi:hypothetical protein